MEINYPYSQPEILKSDINEVVKVLKKGYLAQGNKILEFEHNLAKSFKSQFAVVCNSGTAALHMIYKAIGLNEKNGLITSPITFLATANAARMCNAPVGFSDVDPITGLITPKLLEEAIKKSKFKVKAVTVVHLGGRLCDMEGMAKICKHYKCMLIEDACHAPGSEYFCENNKKYVTGSCKFSDASSFSFHAVKHVTMGEGGCITTNNKKIFKYAKNMRNHFMIRQTDSLKKSKNFLKPWYYEINEIGWNYRADEISCALGLSQLKRLKINLKKRRLIAKHYNKKIITNDIVRLPLSSSKEALHSWHLFSLSINFTKLKKSREKIMLELRKHGIGTQVHYIPLFLQPYYKNIFKNKLTNALDYYNKTLSIPMYTQLQVKDINYIAKKINEVLS